MAEQRDFKEEMLGSLLRIEHKLDELVSLTKITRQSEIMVLKREVLKSKVRAEVYSLCDGHNTVNDIAKKIRKIGPQVSRALSELEEKGLVRSRKAGAAAIYERIM